MKVLAPRKPEMELSKPKWCHHHCLKMRVDKFYKDNYLIVIAGSAAQVRITRRAMTVDEGWFVDWEIIHSQQESAEGRVIFTTEELRAAFGLSNSPGGEFSYWLIQDYGGDSASQGKYIRWQNYLNIPCPGTGHDGDPNVSICLDNEIKDTVRWLLE